MVAARNSNGGGAIPDASYLNKCHVFKDITRGVEIKS